MPRESNARKDMLTATARLLRRRGYHGTGLQEVLSESGAPRGSLYYHFPGGKEQLAAEALRESGARFGRGIERGLAAAPTAAEAIRGIARAMASGLRETGYRDGCPVATTALEVAAENERIGEVASEVFSAWRELFVGKLEADGFARAEAEQLGTLCLAALEGGLLLARSHRDTRALEDVGEALARGVTRGSPRP